MIKPTKIKILVTGGAGYIGSHTCVELINVGFDIMILDNFYNSSVKVIRNIEKICKKKIKFTKGDLINYSTTKSVLKDYRPDAVIHFAALKSVAESVQKPFFYFSNNVTGLINLMGAMEFSGCNNIIFSSSCTVYGEQKKFPVNEKCPLNPPQNPYAHTKQICEKITQDMCAYGNLRAVILRYFNPIGAHSSALIGENPKGKPDNLAPFITRTAKRTYKELTVFGNDYKTHDGTCIRDYIHVVDLAKAHVKSLDFILNKNNDFRYDVFNLGTGKGNSVLEVIREFERCTGVKINYKFGPRRKGDLPVMYADPAKANRMLNWKTYLGLKDMLISAWEWELRNK